MNLEENQTKIEAIKVEDNQFFLNNLYPFVFPRFSETHSQQFNSISLSPITTYNNFNQNIEEFSINSDKPHPKHCPNPFLIILQMNEWKSCGKQSCSFDCKAKFNFKQRLALYESFKVSLPNFFLTCRVLDSIENKVLDLIEKKFFRYLNEKIKVEYIAFREWSPKNESEYQNTRHIHVLIKTKISTNAKKFNQSYIDFKWNSIVHKTALTELISSNLLKEVDPDSVRNLVDYLLPTNYKHIKFPPYDFEKDLIFGTRNFLISTKRNLLKRTRKNQPILYQISNKTTYKEELKFIQEVMNPIILGNRKWPSDQFPGFYPNKQKR